MADLSHIFSNLEPPQHPANSWPGGEHIHMHVPSNDPHHHPDCWPGPDHNHNPGPFPPRDHHHPWDETPASGGYYSHLHPTHKNESNEPAIMNDSSIQPQNHSDSVIPPIGDHKHEHGPGYLGEVNGHPVYGGWGLPGDIIHMNQGTMKFGGNTTWVW
jgi:hypothetical protein